MNILILHPKLSWEGGGDRQVLELASSLEKNRHKVVIFTTEYDCGRCFPAISGKLDIRVVRRREDRQNDVLDIVKARRIAGMIYNIISENNETFDIINCHTNPMHWVAVHLKKMINLPTVWMCNDLPPWFLPFLKNRVILKAGTKKFLKSLCKWIIYKTLLPWYDRFLAKDIDRVIVLDRKNQRMIERAYRKNACVIRSGLDINKLCQGDREKIRRQYGIQANVILLLCIGLLSPNRRHEDVVVSLRLLISKGYNVKLMVMGGDNLTPGYSEVLRRHIERNSMGDKVLLVGSVPEKQLPDFLAASDIFVYPHINQTWGLAPLEAMAARRPTLVSMDTGVSEVLVDYETTLLVPPKEPEILSSKIAELIDDEELKEKLVNKASGFVSNNISWDKYCDEMLGAFKSLC
ncbi:glycosyltransferase family 4 protein [bacterium]|nr:glycosyltransferase family 4 protein [bacterium]